MCMHDPLTVAWTVAFEDIEDGWVMARVLEKPGAMSQGRTREEARDNVRDALRELLLYEASERQDASSTSDLEPIELHIAP